MDINKLKSIIKNALVNGHFTLSASIFQNDNIKNLFEAFFVDGKLRLVNTLQEEAINSITVDGKCEDKVLGSTKLQCSAFFSVINNQPNVELRFTDFTQNWKFSNAFVILQNSIVDEFIFKNILFTLKSNPKPEEVLKENFQTKWGYSPDPKEEVLIIKGVSFSASVNIKDLPSTLKWLFKEAKESIIELSGPIELHKKISDKLNTLPKFIIKSKSKYPLMIVDKQFDNTLELMSIYSKWKDNQDNYFADCFGRVYSNKIFIIKKQPISINFYGIFHSLKPIIINFDSDLRIGKLKIISLDDMVEILGLKDLSNYIPEEIPLLKDVELKNISADLDTLHKRPEGVSIVVGTTKDWKWNVLDIFKFHNMQVNFYIGIPLQTRLVSITFSGSVDVYDTTLNANISLPELNFSISLSKDSHLNLKEWINSVVGVEMITSAFICSDLNLAGNIKNKQYSLFAKVKDIWKIKFDETTIALSQLQVQLSVAKEKNCTIYSEFTIGEILVYVNVKYKNGGLQVSGGNANTKKINLGSFFKNFAKQFGFDALLPEVIKNLQMDSLFILFNTKTKNFLLECKVKLPIDDKEIDITVNIDINKSKIGYKINFSGEVFINGYKFTLIFDKDPTKKSFATTYSHDPSIGAINLHTMLEGIIPLELVPDIDIDLKSAFLAFNTQNSQKNRVFGVDISATINLSNLPLVGGYLPENSRAGFEKLKFVSASKAVTKKESIEFNEVLQNGGVEFLPPEFNSKGVALQKGTNFYSKLMVTGKPLQFNLPLRLDSSNPPKIDEQEGVTQEPDGTIWYPIQKNIGPFNYERIGAKYKDFGIHFPLDVGLNTSVINISLHSLSIGFSLFALADMKYFSPKFNLKGIGLKVNTPIFKIGIDLLHSKSESADGKLYEEYSGAGLLELGVFGVSIMGVYGSSKEDSSLFAYGRAGFVPIGPPFFMVSGFSAGIGYNRELIAPPLNKISDFPLVKDAMSTSKKTMGSMLTSLKKHIVPKSEQNFFAAGISFTIAKLIDGFAMLIFNVGEHFRIDILGYAHLSLPPRGLLGKSFELVFVELALKATFDPAKGVLLIRAALTEKSYLFISSCRLYGGFAFGMWFDDENFGDFVFTFGGYHPSFQIPPHYPKNISRVGAHIDLSIIKIKAELYFALTGRAIMAGGLVEGVFDVGLLAAWISVNLNFLISWEPLFFDSNVYAKVGGKLGPLSAEIGTDIHIWGPNFGGKVAFTILCITIDINFGAEHPGSKREPIPWDKFSQTFLPKADKVCNIAIGKGLLKTLPIDNSSERWVFAPNELSMTLRSIIPIKKLSSKCILKSISNTNSFNIAPMGGIEVDSEFNIKITKEASSIDVSENFIAKPIIQNFPAALWGKEMVPSANDKPLIKDLIAGYTIEGKERKIKYSSERVVRNEVAFSMDKNKTEYSWQKLESYTIESELLPSERLETIQNTLKDTFNNRRELAKKIGLKGFEVDKVPFKRDDYIVAPSVRKREKI